MDPPRLTAEPQVYPRCTRRPAHQLWRVLHVNMSSMQGVPDSAAARMVRQQQARGKYSLSTCSSPTVKLFKQSSISSGAWLL
mmetsp:Transcript_34531/g.76743  ORF Transcript_34531/g.76743 Transcript_34531/m.76743 type:complete len:82 (+) Transcript_34531:815-1060(+)